MKTLPLKFKNFSEDRYLLQSKIPKVNIEFYENIKNLKQINCFLMREINGEIQKFFLKMRVRLKLKSMKNLSVNVVELIVP